MASFSNQVGSVMTMWYIHPVNKLANEEVVRRLSERGEGSGVSFDLDELAEDGRKYDVVQLDYRLLKEMYDETEERSGGDFSFIPFKRERSGEQLRFVPEFLLKKSKSKKVRDAVAFVERKQAEARTEEVSQGTHTNWLVEALKADPRVTYKKY